jgi:hypothetical protein
VIADNTALRVRFNTHTYVQRAYGWQLDKRTPSSLDGGLALHHGAHAGSTCPLALYLSIPRP